MYLVRSLHFVLTVWKTADPTCWLIDSWLMTHWLIWLMKHPFSIHLSVGESDGYLPRRFAAQ